MVVMVMVLIAVKRREISSDTEQDRGGRILLDVMVKTTASNLDRASETNFLPSQMEV